MYEKAFEAIANLLIVYDEDKLIPAFGFGGVPKFINYSKPYMDECFPINGNPNECRVKVIL